ncbi:hypothetical protein MRB53_040928 [Persea americana]|nr:hypothetical protein MRB53_040928 [Persea americana]
MFDSIAMPRDYHRKNSLSDERDGSASILGSRTIAPCQNPPLFNMLGSRSLYGKRRTEIRKVLARSSNRKDCAASGQGCGLPF